MRTLPRPGRRGFATLRVARRLLWPAGMTSPSTLRHRSLILFFCALLAACGADDADDVTSATEVARSFLGGAAPARDLVTVGATRDELGMTRVRFARRIDGLPLDEGDVVAVVAGGELRFLGGARAAHEHLDAAARLDAATAEATARAAVASSRPDVAVALTEPPALVAATTPEGTLHPAWRLRLAGESSDQVLARELVVDASTGAILHHRDLIETIAATGSGVGFAGTRRALQIERRSDGSYALHDLTRTHRGLRTYTASGREALPGKLVTSASPNSWDNGGAGAGAAVDAHAFAAITYDYLASVHARRSIDGADGPLDVVVHWGEGVMNAFWDGKRAVFGDGDGESPLAAGLDVVAH